MANIFKAKTLLGRTGIFSHEVVAPNLVYTTGNQIISGNKTFLNNIAVSGTGVFNGVQVSNIDELYLSGIDIVITGNSSINVYNPIYISGNAVLTGAIPTSQVITNVVYTTGDQIISGLKNFDARPTVNTIPVLLSGENANGLTVFVKNDEPATLLKGQPVYIYGANGNNILVRKASNTGEAYSSKTLGLLAQDLNSNAQGFVITEGALEGLDTNAGNAGDPIWLGPTGNLIFGLTNKPYAPNHLVYLGVIERKQSNNGKIFVKVQNGFELDELHNVNINHYNPLTGNQVLKYNVNSGLWFNETLSSNDLSNANDIVYTTGNQTIFGNKTFAQTGSFNTLQITNKKLSSYSLNSTNFVFGDNYLNFANSSSNIIGILPSGIVSGINYYAKNLNSGIFFISGSGSRTIDGFSTLNLYRNESVQLVGVNSIGYTGWVTISADGGIS